MKKKPLIITCVLLAAAIALSAAVFGFGLGKKKGEEQPKADPNTATAYQALSTTEAFADHPLLPTDFDGIFYSADPNGSFEFYEYKNGGFTKIEASGTVTATVSLSNQSIPAKIAYLQRDGKVDGYGEFGCTSRHLRLCILPSEDNAGSILRRRAFAARYQKG